MAVASAVVIVGLATGSRFRDRAPDTTVLSYRVDDRAPPVGGYILASRTTDAVVAFSPGAQDTMMVLALALHLDPIYVGAHHVARFLLVSFSIPLLARWLAAPPPPPPPAELPSERPTIED